MNRTRSHTIFLIPALIIAILTLSIYFYMYNSVNSSIAATAKAMQSISSHKNTVAHEQQFLDEYKSTVDEWSQLPKLFIPADRIVVFIETMEALGPETNSNVTLTGVGADNLDGQVAGTEGTARGHIDVSGSWSTVMKVLKLSENLPYKSKVSNVRLDTSVSSVEKVDSSGKKIKTAEHIWHMTFDIEVATIVPIDMGIKTNPTQ